jgi:hypothetical protein
MASNHENSDEKKNSKENIFKSYHGGPHGYGDPDSTEMRHAESYIFVTQIVKDRAHIEKCTEEVKSNTIELLQF